MKPVISVPDPPTTAGPPLACADGGHRAKDCYLVSPTANVRAEHSVTAFLVEPGNALDKPCYLFGGVIES